jgi:hypothetical protein
LGWSQNSLPSLREIGHWRGQSLVEEVRKKTNALIIQRFVQAFEVYVEE